MTRLPTARSLAGRHRVGPVLSVLVLTLLLTACATSPVTATTSLPQQADTVSTVEVSGSGEAEVAPDRARVVFSVETEAATAQEASEANARAMDSVIAALREADVDGMEIETRGYTLQPRYRRPDGSGTPEIDGYRARNQVEVVVEDPGAVGELVDVGVGAGANGVASLQFFASDVEEARLEALRSAVSAARREAEVIADAMGVGLGRPLHVQRSSADPPIPMMFDARAEMAQAGPSTPVEPGTQTVRATVTVRYALELSEP